jgi:type II secretory pathway pseudopilin PulG
MKMLRPLTHRRRLLGFTVAELMVGAAISTILAAGLVTGAILLQRNFKASIQYANDQATQARLIDYISQDLRRANTASVASGVLTVTIPDYYDPSGNPRDPSISYSRIYYNNPTASVTIRYFKQGSQVMRQEAGVNRVIADGVESFQLNFVNQGQVVETSISFRPTFQQNGQGDSSGTTVFSRTLLRNLLQS